MRYLSLAFALGFAAVSTTGLAAGVDSVIALSTDNDLFAPTQTDRDYTAGVAFTYASNSPEFGNNVYSRLAGTIDHGLLGSFTGFPGEAASTSLEFGVYGFTPEEISARQIDYDDRPYSSLVYLSTSKSYQGLTGKSGWTTSLTVGALGLDLFESGQNSIHKVIGSDKAEAGTIRFQRVASDPSLLSRLPSIPRCQRAGQQVQGDLFRERGVSHRVRCRSGVS